MKFSAIIDREVEALKRDREYRKKDSYTMDDLWNSLDEYPSIATRFNRFLGTISRTKDKVLSVPSSLKTFVHRGRHGWATPDTWSMDYALAKQLDAMFRGFVTASEHMVDYDEDDTASIALDIADGFAAYVAYQDREWDKDFDPRKDLEAYVQKDREEYDRAIAMVQRSCIMMGENWSRFWW